jgi:zinc protease
MSRLGYLPALAFLLLVPRPGLAVDERDTRLALRTAAALYDGIRTSELPNGLRVFLKPIPTSTAVTTLVVYKVGSADEDKNFTGLSHYLEHLMFKGTARLRPGDIDRITLRGAGSNNAYTTTDLTAFHFTFPAGRWRPALEVEADRMRNLRIDKEHEFDKEKGAVINELAGNEDSPWDLEYKGILPLLFGKNHPYGHPVIGVTRHVRDATEKVIKAHYDRWYHPNNAVLVIVGGFDPDEAEKAIKELFGPIPRAPLPPRKPLPRESAKLPARLEMPSRFSVARILMGFPTVRIGDSDQPALNVLEAILARGKGSRLYRSLVEGHAVAAAVSADHSPGRYPGWFSVGVEVLPGKDRAEVEKLLRKELVQLGTEEVSAAELARAQQLILTSSIFGRESTMGLATSIGEAVTVADLDLARKYLPRILAVTAADVQRVAKKYLDLEKSATVWSVPAEKKAALAPPHAPAPSPTEGRGGEKQREAGSHVVCLSPPLPPWERGPGGEGRKLSRRRAAETGAAGFDLKKAQRVALPNGLVLVLFENHRLPIFEARVELRESSIFQSDDKLGVASLTGLLLDEGTAKRTGAEVAAAIENVGGALSMSASGGAVRVLAPHHRRGLELLLECLTQPRFPKGAFARAKARLLAEIGESEAQPDTRAQRLFRSLAYGKNPLGRPADGTTKTVSGLTPADCADFHRKVFVPNNAILAVVGDFDSKAIVAEIRALSAGWKKEELTHPVLPAIEKPKTFTQKILTMPEASQLQVYMGSVGIRRSNPDYYKLLVMDHILGTGAGFTDRLSSRLRDREGLAYTVSASITSTASLEPGLFTCYIGTDRENLEKVKKMFLEELNRIRDTKPSAKELADVKAYLIGSRLLAFATNSGIATQLLAIERYGLGFDYLEHFQKAVAAVTAADVQAVAKKYIDPSRMVLVAAGAVDADGKPLKGK